MIYHKCPTQEVLIIRATVTAQLYGVTEMNTPCKRNASATHFRLSKNNPVTYAGI